MAERGGQVRGSRGAGGMACKIEQAATLFGVEHTPCALGRDSGGI